MRTSFRNFLLVCCFCALTCGMATAAQTLAIGSDSARPGHTVSIPVTYTATVNCTAALLRIEYDSTRLENATVEAGELVGADHIMESSAPEAGRINIAVFPRDGAPAFTAQSGVMVVLHFKIKDGTPAGEIPVKFTSVGTPNLPSANVIKVNGVAAGLLTVAGKVAVLPEASVGNDWEDYK